MGFLLSLLFLLKLSFCLFLFAIDELMVNFVNSNATVYISTPFSDLIFSDFATECFTCEEKHS